MAIIYQKINLWVLLVICILFMQACDEQISGTSFLSNENADVTVLEEWHDEWEPSRATLQKTFGDVYGDYGLRWALWSVIKTQQNNELRWFLERNTNDGFDARETIRAAFAVWQPFVPFRFVEVTSASNANTVIRFSTPANVTMCSSSQFQETVMGCATPGQFGTRGLGFDQIGDIEINDDYRWNTSTADNNQVKKGSITIKNVTLQQVLVHEIGHTLGLEHDASSNNNVMKSGGNGQGLGRLWDDDIMSITRLYSPGYHFVFGMENVNRIVTEAYRSWLGRDPDVAGLNNYSNALYFYNMPSKQGGYSLKTFYANMGSSTESFAAAGGTNIAWINKMYSVLLKRSPTASERSARLTQLAQNSARKDVIMTILNGNEWANLYVTEVYRKFHRRSPDSSGLLYWSNLLKTNAISPLDVDVAATMSNEYLARFSTVENFLKDLYSTVLGRSADASGLSYWRDQVL